MEETLEELLARAQAGDVQAMTIYGRLLKENPQKPDYLEARRWFEKAAAGNNGEAYYHLAALYEKGLGVEQNYNKAVYNYQQAKSLGYKDAGINLLAYRRNIFGKWRKII